MHPDPNGPRRPQSLGALRGVGSGRLVVWRAASLETINEPEIGFLVADGENVVLSVANHGHIAAIEVHPAEFAELVARLEGGTAWATGSCQSTGSRATRSATSWGLRAESVCNLEPGPIRDTFADWVAASSGASASSRVAWNFIDVYHGDHHPGYLTRAQAERRLAAILADDHGLVSLTPTRLTFGQACDEWLDYTEEDSKRRPSAVRDYRNTTHVCRVRGDATPLDDITTVAVDAWTQTELVRTGERRRLAGRHPRSQAMSPSRRKAVIEDAPAAATCAALPRALQ
jgi:hypothetical protein